MKQRERLPAGVTYSVAGVAKSLVAWTALTSATREWGEARMLEGLREISFEREWGVSDGMNQPLEDGESRGTNGELQSDASQLVVTGVEHEQMGGSRPGETGQLKSLTIVNASIGSEPRSSSATLISSSAPLPSSPNPLPSPSQPQRSFHADLLRFSRIALGSYGGAGLLFFNVPIPQAMQTFTSQTTQDESAVEELLHIVEDAEASVHDEVSDVGSTKSEGKGEGKREAESRAPQEEGSKKKGKVGFWDTVRGRHDQSICKSHRSPTT